MQSEEGGLCPRCRQLVPRRETCPEHALVGVAEGLLARLEEAPLLGQLLDGRFAIVDILGSGGMGVVYAGIQRPLGRPVAVKVLDAAMTATAEARARFEREALALSRLRSNHTVTLFDYGVVRLAAQTRDTAYMVLEQVAGSTLRDELGGEPLPLDVVRVLLVGIARSLDEAHRQGILHRDVKPENILVTGPEGTWHATLIDFGIATTVAGARVAGAPESIIGTPTYMAPELCAAGGTSASPQSDVYAVGAVLFEMLSGAPPFSGPDAAAVLLKHYVSPPPPLPTSPVSDELEPVVHRALAKRPADRYATVEALRDAFDAALEGTDDSLTLRRATFASVEFAVPLMAAPIEEIDTADDSISLRDLTPSFRDATPSISATPREATPREPREPLDSSVDMRPVEGSDESAITGPRRVILQVLAGPRVLDFTVLDRDWSVIGRSSRSEFVLPHPAIASFHARCRLVDGGSAVAVEHLGTDHDTIVNMSPVHGEVTVGFGDLMQVGPFLMKVRAVSTGSLRHLSVLQSVLTDPSRDVRTGLGQPEALDRTLLTLEHRCQKLGQPMSAVLVRIEPFDGTLTPFGDPLGDVVSESVARLAMYAAPDPATCLRTDADDTLVLLVGQTVAGAHRYAEELHERIVAHLWEFVGDGLDVRVLTAVARRVRAPANEWLSQLETDLGVTASHRRRVAEREGS